MLDKLHLTSPEIITLEEATNNLKGDFSHYRVTIAIKQMGVLSRF